MQELKPCPFCGKRPHLIEPDEGDFKWSVSCLHCTAIDMYDISKEDVIEKWNTRHYPPEVEKAVERMNPEKVIERWSQNGIEYGDCPTCICPVERKHWDDHQHCDRCGQALDWSEE